MLPGFLAMVCEKKLLKSLPHCENNSLWNAASENGKC